MVEDAEMEVPDASLASGGAHTLEEMVEFLKAEHSRCPETNEFWDANAILSFLDEVRGSSAEAIGPRCSNRVSTLVSDWTTKATEQNRWNSADRYTAISDAYGS
eukprot:s3206_g6.t1